MDIYIAPQDSYILERKDVFLIDVSGTIATFVDGALGGVTTPTDRSNAFHFLERLGYNNIPADYLPKARKGVLEFLEHYRGKGKIIAIQSNSIGLEVLGGFGLRDLVNYHFLGEPPINYEEYGWYDPFDTCLSDITIQDRDKATFGGVKNFPNMIEEIAAKEGRRINPSDAIVLGDARYAPKGPKPNPETDKLRGDTLSAALTNVDILGIPPAVWPPEYDKFSFGMLIR